MDLHKRETLPILINMEAPYINEEQYNSLVEAGGDEAPALVQELLLLFQKENIPHLEAMEEANSYDDFKKLARHAHAVSGSSANLGAVRLANLAKEIEMAIYEKRYQNVKESMRDVRAVFEKTMEAFKERTEA